MMAHIGVSTPSRVGRVRPWSGGFIVRQIPQQRGRLVTSVIGTGLAAGLAVGFSADALGAPTVTNCGTASGTTTSRAFGISADGTAIIGTQYFSNGQYNAFRWTAAGGFQALGIPGLIIGYGISGDGSVCTGFRVSPSALAFIWTQATGPQTMPTLANELNSSAYGISADGGTIVGECLIFGGGGYHAWRYADAYGKQEIPMAATATTASAFGISADASTIVGRFSHADGSTGEAWRWTESEGMVGIGTLAGGTDATANAADADGSVIVGWSDDSGGADRAFRWEGGAMESLGTLGTDTVSFGYAVNGDGRIVGGMSGIGALDDTTSHAFVWVAGRGMLDLREEFIAQGGNATGWVFNSVRGVSADGSAICGTGRINGLRRAYLIRGLSFPASSCAACAADYDGNGGVDGADLSAFFADYEAGAACSDVDQNGGVDGADLAAFFGVYEAGGC